MYSQRQGWNPPRRSLSNYKCKFNSPYFTKQPKKHYLFFAKLLKKAINSNIKSHFSTIKNESRKKQTLNKNIMGLFKVFKKIQLRNAITRIKIQNNMKLKKICGSKILQIQFNSIVKDRHRCLLDKLKSKYFNKSVDKALFNNLSFLQRFINKKYTQKIGSMFQKMKISAKQKTMFVKKIKITINRVQYRKKLQSFLRINSYNLLHKTSNLQFQPPTFQSQQNTRLIQAIENQYKSNSFKLLKKSTSDTNINSITYRLKDSLQEKSKRSLSRKSRVSSLMEQDFTTLLAGSFSSKDYNNMKYTSSKEKNDYYKKVATSYKKQLQIATSELQIMRQLNQNYENQMQGMESTNDRRQIACLKSEIRVLQKDKQKYKQRSKNYADQIIQMKKQFKNRIQILQMRLKKQF